MQTFLGWLNCPPRSRMWAIATCTAVMFALWAGFNICNTILPTADDKDLYYRYALRTFQGELPYRDFVVEYPPLAMIFFLIPALLCYPLGGLQNERYKWLFHTECLFLNLATLWIAYLLLIRLFPNVWQRAHKLLNWRLASYTFGSVLISLYLYQRFDVGVALFTLLSVWFFYDNRPFWSGAMLGLGFVTKLYPVVLLPLVLLYLWYNPAKRRQILPYLTGFAAANVFVIGPIILSGGTSGLLTFLSYHFDRGVELETIFAGAIVFGSYLGLTPTLTMVDHGSLGLASAWVKPMATASTILTVVGLLAIYGLAWRTLHTRAGRVNSRWLIELFSLTILWFILANKVLSPQYLVWVLAFVPLWRGKLKTVLFLIALPLSFIPFPFLIDWLARLDWLPFLILAIRNSLLLVVFGLLVGETLDVPHVWRLLSTNRGQRMVAFHRLLERR